MPKSSSTSSTSCRSGSEQERRLIWRWRESDREPVRSGASEWVPFGHWAGRVRKLVPGGWADPFVRAARWFASLYVVGSLRPLSSRSLSLIVRHARAIAAERGVLFDFDGGGVGVATGAGEKGTPLLRLLALGGDPPRETSPSRALPSPKQRLSKKPAQQAVCLVTQPTVGGQKRAPPLRLKGTAARHS